MAKQTHYKKSNFLKQKLSIAITLVLLGHNAAYAQQDNSAEEAEVEVDMSIAEAEAAARAQAIEDGLMTEDGIEIIEVSGFRSSATKQLNNKRFSENISDSIFAEDIGKMADSNIAEAMARITGIGIDRADGEGTEITVRGVEGSYNNVQMNGVTMTNSGDDNSVDFSNMSADMLRSIEVIKSATAKQDEGSLGATIKLNTWKPLDLKKPRTSLSISGVYNDLSEEFSPKLGFAFGRNFSKSFGMTASLNYSKQQTRGDRTSNYKWQYRRAANAVDTAGNPLGENYWLQDTPVDFDGNGIPDFLFVPGQGQTTAFDPNAYERSLTFNETETLNLSSTLQYMINDNSSFWVDLTHSQRDKLTKQYNLNIQQLYTTTTDVSGETIHPTAVIGEDGTSLQFSGPNATARQVVWRKPINTSTDTIGLNYQHLFLDGTWTLDAKVGYSHSTQQWPIEESNRLIFNANVSNPDGGSNKQPASADWRDENGNLLLTPIFGTADGEYFPSANLPIQSAQFIVKDIDDQSLTFSFDVEGDIDIGPLTRVSFGAKVIDRERKGEALSFYANLGDPDDPNATRNADGKLASEVTVADYPGPFPANNYLTNVIGGTTNGWDLPNVDAIYNDFWPDVYAAISRTDPNLTFSDVYDADEPTNTQFGSQAVYLMFNYEFLDGDLRGNFGYRYSKTQAQASSRSGFRFREWDPDAYPVEDDFGNITSTTGGFTGANFDITDVVTGEIDYGIGLPSFNARYDITDKMLVRFSISKNMSRPKPSRLIPAYLITARAEGNTPVANGGNPSLNPTEVIAYDFSWEWYFKDTAMVSIAPFYKDFKSMTYRRTDERGFPLSECADASEFPTNVRTEEELAAGLEDGINQQLYRDLHCARIVEGVETTTWLNGDGGEIFGVETSFQQDFDFLPGILKHAGIVVNYTYTDSIATYIDKNGDDSEQTTASLLDGFPMQNTSKDTFNSTLYWENEGLSLRLAYAYRSKRLKNSNSWDGAIWEDDRATVDFSSRYKVSKKLSLNFSITNLTKTYNRTFITRLQEQDGLLSEGSALDGAPDWRTYTVDYNGRNVKLGMLYKF
ncbi:MAG: TonB-dependent receptor [Glaciecola sp.]